MELIADFIEDDINENDVTVRLMSVRYIWCRTDEDIHISLNFFYKIIFSGDISEKVVEVNLTNDLIDDIDNSRYEDFVMSIIKKDSRLANIRDSL